MRHSINPSTFQSRASPRVYMRGRNSSVNVRTAHKPERFAQYRTSVTDWMTVGSGFDCSAEHRFVCSRLGSNHVWAALTSSTNRAQLSRCLHTFYSEDKTRERVPKWYVPCSVRYCGRKLKIVAGVIHSRQDTLEIHYHSYPSSTGAKNA